MKLAVFDFCETLVSFQSADRFVDYIIEKENYRRYKWLGWLNSVLSKARVLAVISKFFPELNPSKRLKLMQVRNIPNEKVEKYANEFYEDNIMTNRVDSIYQLLQKHIQDGDHVMIISGGYSPYIKVFSEQHGLKAYFATEMAHDTQKLTGTFSGRDCLYRQKTFLLEQYLKNHKINYTKSVAYSDSISDLPLLQWADEAFVVSKQKSQPWAKQYGFKEIIHD